MPLYNFTVRAKDDQGAFADRDFSINVRNTITDIVMVAGGPGGVTSSTNGTTWTVRPAPQGRQITYGNGLWVCHGTNTDPSSYGSQSYWVSTDGVNWTQYSTPDQVRGNAINSGPAIHYANGLWMMAGSFVPGGSGSTYSAYTSSNAVNWTRVHNNTLTSAYIVYGKLAYGGGKWIQTTGPEAGSTITPIRVSTDNGVTWSSVTFPSSTQVTDILYVNGMWILGAYSSAIWTSIDGVNWALRTLPNNTGSTMRAWDICYGNGRFLIVSNNDENNATHGWYSTDGINWTRITSGTSTLSANYATGCGFSEGKFYISKGAKLFSSLDCVTWTEVATGIGSSTKGGIAGITMG